MPIVTALRLETRTLACPQMLHATCLSTGSFASGVGICGHASCHPVASWSGHLLVVDTSNRQQHTARIEADQAQAPADSLRIPSLSSGRSVGSPSAVRNESSHQNFRHEQIEQTITPEMLLPLG